MALIGIVEILIPTLKLRYFLKRLVVQPLIVIVWMAITMELLARVYPRMEMMRKAVLDRFEEQMAVFILDDTGEPLSCPRSELAPDISEGDSVLLRIEADKIQEIIYDKDSTEEAKKRIQEKLERLRRGDHLNKT